MKSNKNIMGNPLNCPGCESDLKTFVNLVGLSYEHSYCPECDILKKGFGFSPFLCKNCHSASFYMTDRSMNVSGHDFEKNIHCWLCDCSEFIDMSVKEFYELEEQGKIKKGFYTSKNYELPKQKCSHEELSDFSRFKEDLFIMYCENCNEDIYINIPEWKQEEEGWSDLDVILLKDYQERDKSHEPKLIPFKDNEDLLTKIKKEIRRLR